MEPKRLQSSKEKKMRRKEVLEKKKAIDEIIKKASSVKDHLASFPPFCHYDRNGISVYLESGSGDQLSSPIKKYIQNLLKVNMEGPYGSEWPMEEKVKRREMVAPEARYIFVRESPNAALDGNSFRADDKTTSAGCMGHGDHLVGFVHYRFIVEEDIPVVYVYELQLESCAQGKGLGKFLMQLIELIAHKNHMGAVMLTVQKANVLAMNFYTGKLRYIISTISPSRVDPLIGAEKNYEILCKTFDAEAKTKLELSLKYILKKFLIYFDQKFDHIFEVTFIMQHAEWVTLLQQSKLKAKLNAGFHNRKVYVLRSWGFDFMMPCLH